MMFRYSRLTYVLCHSEMTCDPDDQVVREEGYLMETHVSPLGTVGL